MHSARSPLDTDEATLSEVRVDGEANGSGRLVGHAANGRGVRGGEAAGGCSSGNSGGGSRGGGSGSLVEWKEIERMVPWGVILLLGGGFALADACLRSGLSASVGQNLSALDGLPSALVRLRLQVLMAVA